jgi:hypothetical protein
MKVTKTSLELIQYFEKEGIPLTEVQESHIHNTIYDTIVSSYAEGKQAERRGCDCGQMWCPICG